MCITEILFQEIVRVLKLGETRESVGGTHIFVDINKVMQ